MPGTGTAGAQALMGTLVAAGVDVCCASPGTSEIHVVAALDPVPGMLGVLGFCEGVVIGADVSEDPLARPRGGPR